MRRAAFIGAIALAGAAALGGDWPHFGRDAARSRDAAEPVGASWTPLWSRTLSPGFRASPAVRDGILFASDVRGFVRALDATSGADLWTVESLGPIESSPLALPGVVVAPDGRNGLYAFDARTGAVVWQQAAGGLLVSSPVESDGVVYFGTGLSGNGVEARSAATGGLLWQTSFGQPVFASPVVAGGAVYAVSTDGIVRRLDPATGAVVWSFGLPGGVRIGSPMWSDPYLYIPVTDPEAEVVRVHSDPAMWGVANWTTGPLVDPSPLPGAGTTESVSSVVVAGGRVLVVVRFDHRDAQNFNYLTNEYLFAFDASNGTPAGPPYPILLGSAGGSSTRIFPEARHCPSPVVVDGPGGPAVVVASSVSAAVRLVRILDGQVLASVYVDGPSLASPVVANARIYVATYTGTIWCFGHDANGPPMAPTALSPADGEVVFTADPVFSWSPSADPDDPAGTVSYIVRVDDDGEVWKTWDYEITTAAGVNGTTLPAPLAADAALTWSVRAVDPKGAMSPWAAPQTFYAIVESGPPEPPSNLTASPGDGKVTLLWSASPSADVVGYEVSVDSGPYTFVGNVTQYTVFGLANGVAHDFRVRARDAEGLVSAAVWVSATPVASVSLNGTPYPDLPSAAAAAAPGDTIQLGYGTFVLSGTLYLREGVNLYGISPHETILVGNGVDPVIQLTSGALPRGRIALLTVSGGLIGVDTAGYAVVLENLVVRDNDTGVLVALGSDALVKNVTFWNNTSYGIYNASNMGAIRNSIVAGSDIGVFFESWAGPPPVYNDVHGSATADYVGTTGGTGSISAPVAFLDPAAGDFRVQPGQPTIDAGDPADDWSLEPEPNGNRINMGAYGNTRWAQFGAPDPAGGGGGGGGGGGCVASLAGSAGWAWIVLLGCVALLGMMAPMQGERRLPRRAYRPPWVRSERAFEQNTLSCGKTPAQHLVLACRLHSIS